MRFYRAALDLSRPTLTFVTGLVRDHRNRIAVEGPGKQTLSRLLTGLEA